MQRDNKPHIDSLIDLFHAYAIAKHDAGTDIDKWFEAYRLLKEGLQDLGIADKFDWTAKG